MDGDARLSEQSCEWRHRGEVPADWTHVDHVERAVAHRSHRIVGILVGERGGLVPDDLHLSTGGGHGNAARRSDRVQRVQVAIGVAIDR